MRISVVTVAFMAMCSVTPRLFCQSVPDTTPVREVLRDADYAFRRFDETTERVDFSHWQLPADTLEVQKQAFHRVVTELSLARHVVSKLDDGTQVTTVDLLDLMSALGDAQGELYELSTNTANFQDKDTSDVGIASRTNQLSLDLAHASGAAELAASKVFSVLRQRLVAEQDLLRRCAVIVSTNVKSQQQQTLPASPVRH